MGDANTPINPCRVLGYIPKKPRSTFEYNSKEKIAHIKKVSLKGGNMYFPLISLSGMSFSNAEIRRINLPLIQDRQPRGSAPGLKNKNLPDNGRFR